MQVNLVFLKKDGTTSSFSLPSTVTFIGRRQDCDFCIPLMVVSRKHCEINLDMGKVTIRDLQSRNGTLLNGAPIEEAEAKAGDLLTIGPVEFVFQIDGQPDNFTEYLKAPQAMPVDSADDDNFEESMEDLSNVDLGKSHATEMLDDLGADFDFSDEDFGL